MRKFEKISFDQFKKDVRNDKLLYNEYNLPKRSTKNSAAYDFEALLDVVIKSNEIVKIPLGTKAAMENDEYLMIIVRSSMGFKYNVRLVNQVGIIDSDYYNNISNEGHMFIKLQNHGNEDFIIKKGDRICQGIFSKYLLVEDEVPVVKNRVGWTVLEEEKNEK